MASGVRLAATLLIKHPPLSQYALLYCTNTNMLSYIYKYCTIFIHTLLLKLKHPPLSQYALLYCTNTNMLSYINIISILSHVIHTLLLKFLIKHPPTPQPICPALLYQHYANMISYIKFYQHCTIQK